MADPMVMVSEAEKDNGTQDERNKVIVGYTSAAMNKTGQKERVLGGAAVLDESFASFIGEGYGNDDDVIEATMLPSQEQEDGDDRVGEEEEDDGVEGFIEATQEEDRTQDEVLLDSTQYERVVRQTPTSLGLLSG